MHSFNDYHTKNKNPKHFFKLSTLQTPNLICRVGKKCWVFSAWEFTNIGFDIYSCVSNPDACIPSPAASSTDRMWFLILLLFLKPVRNWFFKTFQVHGQVNFSSKMYICTHMNKGRLKKEKDGKILLFRKSIRDISTGELKGTKVKISMQILYVNGIVPWPTPLSMLLLTKPLSKKWN